MRGLLVLTLLALPCLCPAFVSVPKEAVKALMVTRGKPTPKGWVFVDGRYIPPPYVVKRYGTAIYINDTQVTDPLIPWKEFIKTQEGATVTRTETPAEPAPAPEPAQEEVADDDDDDPLADLFDDDPKPKKAKKTARKSTVRTPSRPTVTTTYALNGDFVPNDASKKLVDTLNRYRADVHTRLARGGFIFFGSAYARVSGDGREAKRLMGKLPEMMSSCSSSEAFLSAARRSGIYYLTDPIANDVLKNRYLYQQIKARYAKELADEKIDPLLKGAL